MASMAMPVAAHLGISVTPKAASRFCVDGVAYHTIKRRARRLSLTIAWHKASVGGWSDILCERPLGLTRNVD